jgi:hypothetical protein
MVRSTLLATAAVSLSLTATEASAHSVHQHRAYSYHHNRRHYVSYRRGAVPNTRGSLYRSNVAAARARGLPWCGAEMADELGIYGQQGHELWLARNWARLGTPTSAHVGAVVVWRHHVGRIVGQENGQWIVRSGNDGGGVRSRTRSLAGAIAIRDLGVGFAVASFAQPQYRASYQPHYQRVARIEHRTPLWMHEQTVQPDHFGAAADS